jgi:hypothetical protein
MSIFNLTDEKMKETSSTFTAHEIYQQPATWRKTCAQLAACKDELQAFIDQVVKQDDFDIVLTGAGTSEFVGNSLFQALNPKYDFKVKSYASTDIFQMGGVVHTTSYEDTLVDLTSLCRALQTQIDERDRKKKREDDVINRVRSKLSPEDLEVLRAAKHRL